MDWVTIGLIALAFIVVISIIVREYVKKDELDIVQKIDQTTKEAKALFDWGDDPNWDKTQDMNLEAAQEAAQMASEVFATAARDDADWADDHVTKGDEGTVAVRENLAALAENVKKDILPKHNLPNREYILPLDLKDDTFLDVNTSELSARDIIYVPVTRYQRDQILEKGKGKAFLQQERQRIGRRVRKTLSRFKEDEAVDVAALDFSESEINCRRNETIVNELLSQNVKHITDILCIEVAAETGNTIDVVIVIELNYLHNHVLHGRARQRLSNTSSN